MKTTFQYDHYYKYDEVKSNLEYFANEYPDLVKLEEISMQLHLQTQRMDLQTVNLHYILMVIFMQGK